MVNGFVSRPPGRLAGVKITRPPGRPRDRDTKPLTTHILVTVFFLLREYVNGFQLPRLMDCFLPSFSLGKVESQSISRALEGAWKFTDYLPSNRPLGVRPSPRNRFPGTQGSGRCCKLMKRRPAELQSLNPVLGQRTSSKDWV